MIQFTPVESPGGFTGGWDFGLKYIQRLPSPTPKRRNCPDNAEARYLKGRANQANKFGEAVDAFNRALDLQPEFADAHYAKGLTLFELGQFNEAVQSYYNVLLLRPKHQQHLDTQRNGAPLAHAARGSGSSFRFRAALRPELNWNIWTGKGDGPRRH